MENLRKLIQNNFGVGGIPNQDDLVKFDGSDELDKREILAYYLGKSWQEIATNLGPVGRCKSPSSVYDLSIMESSGFLYYIRAFLEHLLFELERDPNEVELPHYFFGALKGRLQVRSLAELSIGQLQALRSLIQAIREKTLACGSLPDDLNPKWRKDLLIDLDHINQKLTASTG